ncbi:MAG TPA: c(7)-type cytochrome triheme domain-containing protein [Longimicrobiales bacterium]|nr:c(7)-type cytochrome triheme domain-containing protein [Longimicrobiales bacterium]
MTARIRLAVFAAAVLGVSGCMTVAGVFLDLPEGTGEEVEESPGLSMEVLDSVLKELAAGPVLPPPPIEAVTDADSLIQLLPRDRAGGIDWVAATEDGVIRPRAARPDAERDSTRVFPFDFYLAEGAGPEAYFPHSTHQSWVSCQSCHPTIYRRRGEAVPAERIHEGSSCAYCHNGLAFPISACERCHQAASDLPANRLEPEFGGVIQMSRGTSGPPENSDAERYGTASRSYAPAVFPHGPHRVRFQCRACHEAPYPMQRGATILTEQQAHGVMGCGFCHDGRTAFDTGLDDCYRCHAEVGAGAPEGS